MFNLNNVSLGEWYAIVLIVWLAFFIPFIIETAQDSVNND